MIYLRRDLLQIKKKNHLPAKICLKKNKKMLEIKKKFKKKERIFKKIRRQNKLANFLKNFLVKRFIPNVN